MGVTTYLYLLTSHRMILQVPFSTILPRRVPESYTAGSAPWHCHVPWCCWRRNWRVATGHSSHQQRRAASFRWLRNLRWIRGEFWIWCCMHSRMAISILKILGTQMSLVFRIWPNSLSFPWLCQRHIQNSFWKGHWHPAITKVEDKA